MYLYPGEWNPPLWDIAEVHDPVGEGLVKGLTAASSPTGRHPPAAVTPVLAPRVSSRRSSVRPVPGFSRSLTCGPVR
eukprot:5812574-Pyramimonas_sp.AAC.1